MKHLTPTLFFLSFASAVAAQPASSPDTARCLWFTGHWSATKKNVFIIASSSGGGTATIGNDGTVQIKTGDLDSWNKRWDQAQQSEAQFIQQLGNPKDNLEPFTHQFYQLMKPEAELRQQEVESLKVDPKQDVLNPDSKPGQSQYRTVNEAVADFCRNSRSDYDLVINWWKAHRRDKDADLTYPAPPTFEFDCYACDSNIRNHYQQSIDDYARDFFHPEDSLIRKALAILRFMSMTGYEPGKGIDPDSYRELFSTNKKDPSQSAACSYMNLEDLAQSVVDLAEHAYHRAAKLMHDNRKNFKAVDAVARIWCEAARNLGLLTGHIDDENTGLNELAGILSYSIDYYYNKFKSNDWRQIGNITYMLGLYRQQALLGFDNDGSTKDYLQRLQKIWNGFKLSIEMDIKIGKDNGYRLAHLKGECHIIPAFQRDSNQCYTWVVADENLTDIIGFIRPAVQQTIDCNLIANEIISPPQAPKLVYVGTRKYTSTLQSLAMDFCNPGHDTIMLTGFRPNPATAGLWQIPYAGPQNLGANGMEHFFEDEEARKKLAVDGEAQKAAGDMKQQAEQLKKQMEQLKSQMTGPQAGANYEKMMELFNSTHKPGTAAVTGKILWLFFLMPVQNNSNVLVDKRFDAKEINPREAPVIQYGYYTIHIENDGNGKTQPKQHPQK